MRPDRAGRISVAIWMPIALTGLVLLVSGLLYRIESQRIAGVTLTQAGARAEMFARFAGGELRSIAEHARILADGDSLHAFLGTGSREEFERAVQRAQFISRMKSGFDQVRFIDAQGREVIRVDQGGRVVPEEMLQEKLGRSYVQQGLSLEPGGIHLSAFDLNVEKEVVEQPIKPVFRVTVPVFDDSGVRRGIYVINVRSDRLFAEMEAIRPDLRGQVHVLNPRGYWLRGADPSHEWGFMIPEREGMTLARTDPELWRRMSEEPRGGVHRDRAMHNWHRLDLADQLGPRSDLARTVDGFLVFAIELSGAEYDAAFTNLLSVFATLTGLLVVAALVVGRLVYARMQAGRALRRSEESLSVTLNSIGDAVLATDTGGRVTRLNPVAERLTGWSHSEAAGKPVSEVLHIINEHTREPAEIPVDAVLRTGETKGLANHTVLIARDGTERPIADSAAPIRGRSGGIVGVVLVFRDVAAERAAQQELDRFFSLSLDLLCIASGDGRFKRVSPAVTDVLGWSVKEFLATPYMEMVHPEDREATATEVDRQLKSGERVMQFDNRYRHKDGSWRVLSWRSAPYGELMYASARDVTELREHHKTIEHLNADLARKAVQLGAANEELEAFSYSVSHDLRAPLRHVQGYVEMLMRDSKDALPEKSQRYLQTISEAARDMGRLIDDLLSFSRMARAELREETVDLNALVDEVRSELAPTAGGRDIRWTVPRLPAVRGDEAMLKQVLANLLDNAVKYTRMRSVAEIEIGFTRGDDEIVEFSVRDNGAGFDMKYADKLFGVFQRLHRADEFEGTGIGLANVHRIIARHGGSTRAEGEVGKGATFYFSLNPAAAEPTPQPSS